MAISPGLYGLTLEKMFIDSLGKSLESETDIKLMLVQNGYTPAFDTHDFRDDVTNEPGASGTYASGGSVLTGTELAVGSPSSGQIRYISTSPAGWTGTTITARGAVGYVGRGGLSSADEVIWVSDFGGDVSTAGGTFTVTVNASNGWFYIDYTP